MNSTTKPDSAIERAHRQHPRLIERLRQKRIEGTAEGYTPDRQRAFATREIIRDNIRGQQTIEAILEAAGYEVAE